MSRNIDENLQEQPSAERSKVEFWNIVLFELAGTALLVYGSLASDGQSYGIALIYFACLLLFGRISGGHFNPVVTIIIFIEGAITAKKASYYVVAQLAGAFLAAMISLPILNLTKGPYIEQNPMNNVVATLIAELIGSSMFFLFICVQMNKKTQISSSPIISALFISIIFFATRQQTITMSNSLFNPAAAIGLEVFYGLYYGAWDQWINLLSFIAGPWLGALMAQGFYHKIYVRTLDEKE